MSEKPALMKPVQRIKFDRWAFDHGVDNVWLGAQLGAHPVSVGRWRKYYDHPARRLPPPDIIHKIDTLTAGAVRPEDWYRPCEVKYLPPLPMAMGVPAATDVAS